MRNSHLQLQQHNKNLFFLLFLLVLLSTTLTLIATATSSSSSLCVPVQRSLLLELKKGFSFDPYFGDDKLDSWRAGTDCCQWEGITCDDESGLVIKLDISAHYIIGNITSSSALFNLTSLQSLNLAYNYFNEFHKIPIPTEIEKLANLTYLNLQRAGFYGQIPKEISKLTNLVSLDLSNNDGLELKNPNFETLLKNLTNLRELYLGGIDISGGGGGNNINWSSPLAKWTPQLQVLSLSDCSLSGPLHWHSSSLSKLHNLSVLQLDENPFNSIIMPHSFSNFSSLEVLSLSDCGLRGFFPTDLFLLQNLTRLFLYDNLGLSGYLTDFAVGSKLEVLGLSGTNFSGPLPNSIGNLKFLITLDLSDCQFSGAIPSSIANMTQLQYLYLSDNSFSGIIPLGPIHDASPTLLNLELDNNKLSGEISMSLYQLSGLETLYLNSNNFSGTIEIDQFKQLRNLKALELSYNQFTVVQIVDEDDDNPLFFPNMTIVGLASCNLSTVPNFLRYIKYLEILDLSDNKISGKIPWLWNLNHPPSLHTLPPLKLNLSHNLFSYVEFPIFDNNASYYISLIDLSSNMLQGSIPLPPTTFTEVLDYSNNNFSSSIPSNISSYLINTVYFSLANNNLIGHIPTSICNRVLKVLDLSGNNLSGSIPSCHLEGSSLGVLNLHGNQLEGTIPHNISKGCALQTLKLGMNQIKGHLPRSLANCHSLEVLDVGNNHINDSFPFWLGEIHTLRVLVLRSNHFYGLITPSLGNHQSNQTFLRLQLFDISSNHFSGSLPDDYFKNLKAMMIINPGNRLSIGYQLNGTTEYYQDDVIVTDKGQYMMIVKALSIFTLMDFSNNDFEGNIPEVIGELSSLNVLNFSHNVLRGKIPTSIGNLKLMESLDLSRNHLSGEIPQTLCDLTFLSVMNLSNNDLVGVIPQRNQLSTFSNSSFQGNEGLCGPPLSKQCYKRAPTNTSIISNTSTSKSYHSPSTYVLGLALFSGIGFGVGMAIVLVLQNMK